MMYF